MNNVISHVTHDQIETAIVVKALCPSSIFKQAPHVHSLSHVLKGERNILPRELACPPGQGMLTKPLSA